MKNYKMSHTAHSYEKMLLRMKSLMMIILVDINPDTCQVLDLENDESILLKLKLQVGLWQMIFVPNGFISNTSQKNVTYKLGSIPGA